MHDAGDGPIDWQDFEATRARLGVRFAAQFAYFLDDSRRSLEAIERAIQSCDAAAIIVPADRLAEDAALFGAARLARLAGHILDAAQLCLDTRQPPHRLLPAVIALRPCISETLTLLRERASPLVVAKRSRRRPRQQVYPMPA